MTIIRAPRPESNWYQLDKRISEDRRLSWAARGLLIYLLGKPDHWAVSPAALINETRESVRPSKRDAVYGLLKELLDVGYLQRVQNKNSGKFDSVDYIVSESPGSQVGRPSSPLPDFTDTGRADTGQTYPANPPLVSTEKAVSNDIEQEKRASASRLSADWTLKEESKAWALRTRPDWTPEFVDEIARAFKSYYTAGGGAAACKPDWDIAWQNWVRAEKRRPPAKGEDTWMSTASGIERRGAELSIFQRVDDGESFPEFKFRVFQADAEVRNGGAHAPRSLQ